MPRKDRTGKGGKLTVLSEARLAARAAGDYPRCGAKKVNGGGICKNRAGAGTDHPGYGACHGHGGRLPASGVHAAREQVAVIVDEHKRFYGVKAEISFEEALLEEMQRSVGVVRWIESKLAQWGTDGLEVPMDLTTGLPALMEVHDSIRSITVADTEHAAWLRQYLMERKHLAAVAKAGIDAGVAKGVLMVYARQAETLNLIIRETLNRLGVGDDDRLPYILPTVIRELTA